MVVRGRGRRFIMGRRGIRDLKTRVGRECSISRGGPDCAVEVYSSEESEERVTVLRRGEAPRVRAGIPSGKSIIDQVVLLLQNMKDTFEAKKKAGAVFVCLTAAYDTVWHRGTTCSLLRLLQDNHLVRMMMELVRNRSFALTTGDSKPSKLPRLKNGITKGSALVPLFSTYTYTSCLL